MVSHSTLTMDRLLFISLLFVGVFKMATITTARTTPVSPTDGYLNQVFPNTPILSVLKDLLHPHEAQDTTPNHVSQINPEELSLYNTQPHEALDSSSIHVSQNNQEELLYKKAVLEASNLFFMEKDLRPGTVMTLKFAWPISSTSSFLARKVADTIPFSSNKLPEILDHLSIRPGTPEATAMEGTIRICEKPPLEGETKYCATSFESMVDFASSELKTPNVMPIVTTSANGYKLQSTLKQPYTITSSNMRQIGRSEMVVCHPMTYPHGMFVCHRISDSKAIIVPMVGKDGTVVEAAAICHFDTSKWNPDHLAFQVLKVRPGTPVCHILPHGIIWLSKN